MTSPCRIAFCFHDPAPSGASLWLHRFLLSDSIKRERILAVLPPESPLQKELEAAGIACRALDLRVGALSEARGMEMLRVARNRMTLVGKYRRLFRGEAVNLVYTNSSYQVGSMVAASREKLPLIVHVREAWISGRTFPLKRWALRRYAGAALFDARRGMELFGPAPGNARWEFSPNGVDESLAEQRVNRAEWRSEFGWQRDERIVLFLGTLSRRKGTHDVLSCWPRLRARFPKARFVAAGGIDKGESDPAIRAFAENPPEGMDYLGFRSDAHRLLAAADVFVLPSYGEAMPISISEAMMIGTPVVARNVGDVAWQIGGGRGFLFAGDGAERLEEALGMALEDPALAEKQAAGAQAFAREYLTQTRQYRQVAGLIEDVLGQA